MGGGRGMQPGDMRQVHQIADRRPHVVIVGGGFGGTHAAHALRHAPVRVTVIDRTNHSVFHPLLYQVATAALSADEIAVPIRTLLRRQQNAAVLMAEVTGVDLDQRIVQIGDRQFPYDYLILATGSQYSYFGQDDWAAHALSLKTIADAAHIRRTILQAFEQAELETDPARIRTLLTFVLVGAGPTGVEMAGALAELARITLAPEYRHIDTRTARIILCEAGPHILPTFPEDLARKAHQELVRKGVEVRTNAAVTAVDASGVVVGGEHVASGNVIWTAGVVGTPLGRALGVPVDRHGRVQVQPDLSIPGYPEVFAVGDLMVVEQDGKPFAPGVAPVAIQQGTYVGKLIARRVVGHTVPGPFRYRDKGSLATIGRSFAIADLGRLKLSGLVAWLLWLTVHLYYLANLWDRIQVFATWAWAYVTYQRAVRVLSPVSLERAGRVSLQHARQPLAMDDARTASGFEEAGQVTDVGSVEG